MMSDNTLTYNYAIYIPRIKPNLSFILFQTRKSSFKKPKKTNLKNQSDGESNNNYGP